MRALVIVPTYNEQENLPRLIPSILAQGEGYDVLIVDDNSPDGTGEIADMWAARTERVRVIHRAGKLGLGTAYVAGFKFALAHGYDLAFEMDADFSHDPHDLPRLLAAVRHADVAIGSRWAPGGGTVSWSLLRKAISRGGSLYAGALLGVPVRDLTSGFKCFRRRVLAALDLDRITSSGYGFQVEVNYYCHALGFHIVEVPIVFPDRTAGTSKMSSRIVVEAARVVWQLRGTPAPTAPALAASTASAQPRRGHGARRGAGAAAGSPDDAVPAAEVGRTVAEERAGLATVAAHRDR